MVADWPGSRSPVSPAAASIANYADVTVIEHEYFPLSNLPLRIRDISAEGAALLPQQNACTLVLVATHPELLTRMEHHRVVSV